MYHDDELPILILILALIVIFIFLLTGLVTNCGPKFCPECGERYSDKTTYCKDCGVELLERRR